MQFFNIAGYKFFDITTDQLVPLRDELKAKAEAYEIKGTILLSEEGVNLFMAGEQDKMKAFQAFLIDRLDLDDISFRESWSDRQPNRFLQVKIRDEIIALKQPQVDPRQHVAPYVEPEVLKQWYEQGRDMVVLDTRNDYEYDFGSFDDAIHLNIENFNEFADAIKQLPESMKDKTVVTFCTGGIRCEKAAAFMEQEGFNDVLQLHGGILNYFDQCGGEHYHGECFVFDRRVAVNAKLEETTLTHCLKCQTPMPTQSEVLDCPKCDGVARDKYASSR